MEEYKVYQFCFRFELSTQNFFISLQCQHAISPVQNTMHILSHYKGYCVSGLCKHLRIFLNKHINWVGKVGKTVLSKKHIAVEDYANSLSEGEIPVDPLGLLCIARNWHIHIGVFLKKGVWTTRRDNSLYNVRIYLLYTGGFTFFDTCIQRRALSPIFTSSDYKNNGENNGENLSNQKSTGSDTGSQGAGTKSGDEGGTKSSLASTGTKSGLGSTCTKQTSLQAKKYIPCTKETKEVD